MGNRSIADNILQGARQALESALQDAWPFLDKQYYPGTTEPVQYMQRARECCRLCGTYTAKAIKPVEKFTLRDELISAVGEVLEGVFALDGLIKDPRIDDLMRYRAKVARDQMKYAAHAAQMRYDLYSALMVAADALEGVAP